MATTPAPKLDPNSITRSHLNQGQQDAADGFFGFLFSDAKSYKISGGGGVGKTFLMLYIIKEVFPQYFQSCKLMGLKAVYDQIDLTATTNKAAEVLESITGYPTSTIHSYLNLKVYDDYKTGESKLVRGRNWRPVHNKVIFIDECSFIDRHLLKELQASTVNCKIVYVGDHCQLAPIKEPVSPIYRQDDPMITLTQPMRNANQPALQAVCQQLRETVETGVFKPIHPVPGIIDVVGNAELEKLIHQHFIPMHHNDKILAYTNKKVIAFNDHIRTIRGLPDQYTVGETLISNQACHTADGMIPVEREVEIIELGDYHWKEFGLMLDEQHYAKLKVQDAVLKAVVGSDLEGTTRGTLYHVQLPVDREHYYALIKHYGKIKSWPDYYDLKNNFPDLRARDASTVHKAQGSSYDTVFIDFSDMNTCRQADVMARMLYVAFTRARNRIYLYGQLADKFGGMGPPIIADGRT